MRVPRRIAVAIVAATLVAGALAGCSESDDSASGAAGADLSITFRDPDAGGADRVWTLGCAPASGDLPDPAAACERLAGLGSEAWAPVPGDVACAEIFGGPQTLSVEGRHDGADVAASFSRTNACEIARYDRIVTALGLGQL